MHLWMRRLHLALAWLFVGAVLFQVYLAGRAIFISDRYWQDHVAWGWTGLPLIAVLVLATAIAGRLPRTAIGWAGLPLLGAFVQFLLAAFRYSGQTEVAALHPVTAVILFGIGVVVARRARVFVQDEVAVPATST